MENAYILELSDSKFKDLFLSSCGYAQCQPLHSYGPAVRPNYLIHFILEGRGIYQVGERRYELQAGQGFMIEPEVLTYYQADAKEPWTYLWVAFGGKRAGLYVHDMGLNSSQLTFQSAEGKTLRRIIMEMLKNNAMTISNQYYLQSLLYQFFAVLSKEPVVERTNHRNRVSTGINSGESGGTARTGDGESDGEAGTGDGESSGTARTSDNFYMERALAFVKNHYSEGISVQDMANHVCVNRSYLYKLFKKSLNMSPGEFLMRFRVTRAWELLSLTDQTVENVALSCGYRDALVFSKAFKKETGMTPTAYRKAHKGAAVRNLLRRQDELDEMILNFKKETF